MSERLSSTLAEILQTGEIAALVRITDARGSTPREIGVQMVVTLNKSFGTIGGGALEWDAIDAARRMLAAGEESTHLKLPLGPALGQCCGGHVSVRIQRADAQTVADLGDLEIAEQAGRQTVLLFGAGHVGRALAPALAPLPLRLRWIDSREDAFPSPLPEDVESVLTDNPVAEIETAPPNSAVVVMTHSHALDFDLIEASLNRQDLVYVGLIGSVTKRRRFQLRFVGRGGDKYLLSRLVCPIGGTRVSDKRPAVIAAMVTAEILDHLFGQYARIRAETSRPMQEAVREQ